MDLPEAVVILRIEPKTQADQDKLSHGLQKLMIQDSTFRVNTDIRTGQTIIRGMSELHVEDIVDRLKREFNVDAALGKMEAAYKEMLTRPAEGEGRFAKQIRGSGQYGHVKIRLLPGARGSGYVFENRIVGHLIPNEFIKPIDEGIREALSYGALAGYPVDDVRIELYGGSFHDKDSSEIAFKVAGSMAFRDAAKKADPVLLEPIMSAEVVVPDEYMGNVIDDLNSRRGQITGMELKGTTQTIVVSVPLSEMLGYANDLRLRTDGSASYSMQFDRYEPFYGSPDNDDEDWNAPIAAPRTPAPKGKHSGVQLPLPNDEP